MKTIKAADLHDKRMADNPAYRDAYDALEDEFALVASLITARTRAKLSQAEVASQ
ncbi:hypothetical protein [Aureimonas sp. ME7]|uniref:hypothetical protein n=1 Tax=Aureimonas sp. ME7 TaxID=2744252 RepID=UPI0015F83054|nr:hypothetical protein [Aureimonas sp. ME7]